MIRPFHNLGCFDNTFSDNISTPIISNYNNWDLEKTIKRRMYMMGICDVPMSIIQKAFHLERLVRVRQYKNNDGNTRKQFQRSKQSTQTTEMAVRNQLKTSWSSKEPVGEGETSEWGRRGM